MNIKCMRDTLRISRPLLRCSFNGTNDMNEVERNVETIPATPFHSTLLYSTRINIKINWHHTIT